MEGLCQSSALAASRAPGTARADTEPAVLLTGPGTCPCAQHVRRSPHVVLVNRADHRGRAGDRNRILIRDARRSAPPA